MREEGGGGEGEEGDTHSFFVICRHAHTQLQLLVQSQGILNRLITLQQSLNKVGGGGGGGGGEVTKESWHTDRHTMPI